MENILVGSIILMAVGFVVYRIFFRPSCGGDCGCSGKNANRKAGKTQNGSCCGQGGQCARGK